MSARPVPATAAEKNGGKPDEQSLVLARVHTQLGLLRLEVDNVHRILVSTSDGLAFAESNPATPPDATTGDPQASAMTAAALALGQQIGAFMVGGNFLDCAVRTTDGLVMVYTVGSNHVLAISAAHDVNQAMLHRYARRTVVALDELLSSAATRVSGG